jgi:hypothetical protein
VSADLPKYKGSLGSASWAEFRVTPAVSKNLALAALPGCSRCNGHGWTGEQNKASICPCTNRPPDKFDRIRSQEDFS